MKLRMREGSVRLRLTRGEVLEVAKGGVVEEVVRVGPGSLDVLRYALGATKTGETIRATLSGTRLVVDVPEAELRAWATGDAVSLRATQEVGEGDVLSVLVEKDFACLERRDGEDDADAFPHPRKTPR